MGKKLTTQEFIEKARAKHGDKYDYRLVDYVNAHEKVFIICGVHGTFLQRPNGHLSGRGCPECAIYQKKEKLSLSTAEFVERAVKVHGSTYTYDHVAYVNNTKPVLITCKVHGDFTQTPDTHLTGAGCAKCAGLFRYTTEEFIEEAVRKHNGLYSYQRTHYQNAKKKITITCPKHGDFEQEANSHLRGSGCPKCAITGFNPSKKAFIYFLLDTETHSRVKIGVSNVPDKRLLELKRNTPFTLERIDLFETPPEITLQIESLCHYHMESANLKGFDGATEWFKFDGGKLEALRSFILSFGGAAK